MKHQLTGGRLVINIMIGYIIHLYAIGRHVFVNEIGKDELHYGSQLNNSKENEAASISNILGQFMKSALNEEIITLVNGEKPGENIVVRTLMNNRRHLIQAASENLNIEQEEKGQLYFDFKVVESYSAYHKEIYETMKK